MLFWIVAAALSVAVAAILARGALRGSAGASLSAAQSDIAVYRDQLAEIERDQARGVLGPEEAETARLEVSRRLLDADRRASAMRTETNGNRILLVTTLLFLTAVVAGSLGVYAFIGAPGTPDQPLALRIAEAEELRRTRPGQEAAELDAQANLPPVAEPDPRHAELLDRLREAVAERPDDVEGLRLLAEHEARVGNLTASRRAQERLVEVLGPSAVDERMTLFETMVYAAGGYVSPEAESVLTDLRRIAPGRPEVYYYSGLAEAQVGRYDLAFPYWRRLLEAGPRDAPWVPVIRANIGELARAAGVDYQPPAQADSGPGPDADAVAAASEMTAEERQEMIRGMVEGLAARLADEGGTVEEWARLVRALGVLGETERAAAIAAEARQAFGEDPDAIALIDEAEAGSGSVE